MPVTETRDSERGAEKTVLLTFNMGPVRWWLDVSMGRLAGVEMMSFVKSLNYRHL